METEEKQDVSVDFYAVWDLEQDVLAERAPEVRTNQKLGLLIGFLSVHDWYLSFSIHPFFSWSNFL
jgi:THO complex subunit 2